MKRFVHFSRIVLLGAVVLGLAAPGWAAEFDIARIFIEYNSTDNDLGFHVSLDAEDWKTLKITNPNGKTIYEVTAKGPFGKFGMTELFTEGAEPSLEDVPLAVLLGEMIEGDYTFIGMTVGGVQLLSTARLSHAVPRGPVVSAEVDDDEVTIRWSGVGNNPPPGFPNRPIHIVGYQVIVGSFQVTLPASARQVELPEEFVRSLRRGEHDFEVLAIDRSGNQTISSSSFFTD